MSPVTICTLWEKDYHKALGTFVNSLARVGYRGRVWAGYRGPLPPWAGGGLVENDIYRLPIAAGIELMFCKLNVRIHFAQYKALWMTRVLTELEPAAQGIYYFDPDIFVLTNWTFFERWLACGIAACEDVNYPINPTHPIVRMWERFAEKSGYTHWNPPKVYLNSGLLGITRHNQSLLKEWQIVQDAMQKNFGVESVLKTGTRADMFHATDQDALNVAMAVSDYPVAWIGLDGMGFGPDEHAEWLTLHALSKPWRRRIFRDLLFEGHRPDAALCRYWDLAGGPIQVEPRSRVRGHRFYIPVATLLARFYSRPGRLLSS